MDGLPRAPAFGMDHPMNADVNSNPSATPSSNPQINNLLGNIAALSNNDSHPVSNLAKKRKIEVQPFQEVDPRSKTPLMLEPNRQKAIHIIKGLTKHDLESTDENENTGLHYWTLRNEEDVVAALLSQEINPSPRNCHGMTPLHLASQQAFTSIIQLLSAFGADINILNRAGETPLHLLSNPEVDQGERYTCVYVLHSLGAKRCDKMQEACHDGCSYSKSFEGNRPVPFPECPNDSNLHAGFFDNVCSGIRKMLSFGVFKGVQGLKGLSLDGGGSAGIIAIQILIEIERELGCPIMSKVNWGGGTSSGSLTLLALAKGKSAKEIHAMFWRITKQIFDSDPPYDSSILRQVIDTQFGYNFQMKELGVKHNLMVTATQINQLPFRQVFLRTYPAIRIHGKAFENEDYLDTTSMNVSDVLQSATLAPTYFLNKGKKLVDGGLCANNPSEDLLQEMQLFASVLKETNPASQADCSLVLSIGTGLQPVVPIQPESIDADTSNYSIVFHPWDTTSKLHNLFLALIKQVTKKTQEILRRAKQSCMYSGVFFDRLDPPLSVALKLDETNTITIAKAIYETQVYMRQNPDKIKRIVDRLLDT